MREGWETVPLGQLCSIKSGKSDTKDAVEDGAYAFFDRSRTIKRSSRYLYDCEALIIPGEGTEFFPKHFDGKFDLHQRAYALFDFSNRIDVKFLFYYLHHQCDYFPRVAVGATVKSLRLRHFEELPVALTALSEQQRIVTILDEAFESIAAAKANAEKTLQNARAVFDSCAHSILTQGGEGWIEKSLGEMASFRNGVNFTRASRGESVRIVGVKDFRNRLWAPLDDLDVISVDGSLSEKDAIQEGDLLLVRSNGNLDLIGRTLLIGPVSKKTTHSGFTIRARLLDGRVLPRYAAYALRSGTVRKQMIAGGTGTSIKSLSQGVLSALVLPIPPLLEQAWIVERLDELGSLSQRLEECYERKLGALEKLKHSLLHEAFTGRLTALPT